MQKKHEEPAVGQTPLDGLLPLVGRLRLGPGVVGQTVVFACVVAGVFGIAAWRLNDPRYILGVIFLFLLFIVYFLHRIFSFAEKHPSLSIMGGADAIAYKQLEMGTKDNSQSIFNVTPIPNPALEQVERTADDA